MKCLVIEGLPEKLYILFEMHISK